LKILILHGLLHLAGYDHETDQGEMRAYEARLRKQFGLPTALIERAGGANLDEGRPPSKTRLAAKPGLRSEKRIGKARKPRARSGERRR
jgi:probable rRNA maturation factor